MKLLTLNTHSLIEENYEKKLKIFVRGIAMEQPDIIALQEVNQSVCAKVVEGRIQGYFQAEEKALIRDDNHVYRVVKMLASLGVYYNWTWIPLKCGYGRFEEGIALMSRSSISEASIALVSATDDFNSWKTRKLLGICTKHNPKEWFYSVHFGWWDDEDEPFQNQWKRAEHHMLSHEKVWLMGDFNSPAEVRGEGYDMILKGCWHDTFLLAERKDSGITVGHVIDGWHDKAETSAGMRIDHIWCSEKEEVKSSRVVFNRVNYPVVSDHYGVIIETE